MASDSPTAREQPSKCTYLYLGLIVTEAMRQATLDLMAVPDKGYAINEALRGVLDEWLTRELGPDWEQTYDVDKWTYL